jgi:hypothetical protein
MPLILHLAIAPPVIRPKNRAQLVHRKEYESLYSSVLASRDPGNSKKLHKAVEKAVECGKYTCQDDSY